MEHNTPTDSLKPDFFDCTIINNNQNYRVLVITLANGEQYELPIEYVAENKSNAYGGCYDVYDEVMLDHSEALDWFKNNMEYDSYQHKLRRISEDYFI